MERPVAIPRHSPTTRWVFFDNALGDRTSSVMEALDGFGSFTTGLSFLAASKEYV